MNYICSKNNSTNILYSAQTNSILNNILHETSNCCLLIYIYWRLRHAVQTQAQSQLFLYIHSYPLSSLFFPQHSLTALNARPKMRHLTPHSLGSRSIRQPRCSTISIWGRKAGPRRSWGPLPQLCRPHPPPPAATLILRRAALTPLCPWKNRGEEVKWDKTKIIINVFKWWEFPVDT